MGAIPTSSTIFIAKDCVPGDENETSPFVYMTKPPEKKSSYLLKDQNLNLAVQRLIQDAGSSEDADLLIQMVTTVLKLQDEKVERGDLKILNTTLKELRWAFRVYRPYRSLRKVCIFGSARTPKQSPAYTAAREFGALMVKSGWMVVTGGAGGIMGAGNEGAGRASSFGANILLPFEQAANPVVANDKKLINFRYFFTRKLIFVKESDAICLFPGGFGTLDEGFEVLTLIQTGKMMPRPIVMVEPGRSRYWQSWLRFIHTAILKHGLIDEFDMDLFQMVRTPEQAQKIILDFYRNYHSMRFVGEQLVIRIKNELSKEALKRLNLKFKDIIVKGRLEASGPLPAEASEHELAEFPRLVFHFNRKSYGRLTQMINEINK